LVIDHPLNMKCCIINKLSQAMSHDSDKTASDKTGAIQVFSVSTLKPVDYSLICRFNLKTRQRIYEAVALDI